MPLNKTRIAPHTIEYIKHTKARGKPWAFFALKSGTRRRNKEVEQEADGTNKKAGEWGAHGKKRRHRSLCSVFSRLCSAQKVNKIKGKQP
jgi:hypothetical protein